MEFEFFDKLAVVPRKNFSFETKRINQPALYFQ